MMYYETEYVDVFYFEELTPLLRQNQSWLYSVQLFIVLCNNRMVQVHGSRIELGIVCQGQGI